MNLIKIGLAALLLGGWLAGPAFAAEKNCCEKAKAESKPCPHKCCVAAKKAGKDCEKCNPRKKNAGPKTERQNP